MKNNELKEYLTVGELAALYDMPKQTLIYFANTGVLKPAYVHSNGYRYYSIDNVLMLEIILSLRELDVPAVAIKDFLSKHWNTDGLLNILKNKREEYQKKIAENEKMLGSINSLIANIEGQTGLALECFQTMYLPETPIIVSECFDDEENKNDITEYARHNKKSFAKTNFSVLSSGWVIDKNDFIGNKLQRTKCYFTPVANVERVKGMRKMPEGLYVRLNYSGNYYKRISRIREKLLEYISRNKLMIVSDVYNLPLKNHWQTSKTNEYINQLSVRAEYIKS